MDFLRFAVLFPSLSCKKKRTNTLWTFHYSHSSWSCMTKKKKRKKKKPKVKRNCCIMDLYTRFAFFGECEEFKRRRNCSRCTLKHYHLPDVKVSSCLRPPHGSWRYHCTCVCPLTWAYPSSLISSWSHSKKKCRLGIVRRHVFPPNLRMPGKSSSPSI